MLNSSDQRNTVTLMAGDRSGQRMAVRACSGTGVTVSLDQARIVTVSEGAAVEDVWSALAGDERAEGASVARDGEDVAGGSLAIGLRAAC
jgi:hypothetical protein